MQRGLSRIKIVQRIRKPSVVGRRAEIVRAYEDLRAFANAAGEKDQRVEDAVLLASVTNV